MMTSLSNKYERLKKIPEDLGLDESLLPPEQDPSRPKKKRKAMELEHKTYIVGLLCNKKLPERVPFVNNLVIEQPEHGMSLNEQSFYFYRLFSDSLNFQSLDLLLKLLTALANFVVALGYKPMSYSVLLPILVSGLDTNSPDELLEDYAGKQVFSLHEASNRRVGRDILLQPMTRLAAAIDVISATNMLEFTNEDIEQEWNCHLRRVIRHRYAVSSLMDTAYWLSKQ
ncbi:hypothetical protein Tco_1404811 [Tanacetum coccineum]